MKILGAAISSGQKSGIKTALVSRAKGGLILSKAQKMTLQEIANYSKGQLMLTLDYSDYVATEAELPPITDRKSIQYLVHSKVIDLVRADKEYTYVLHNAVLASDIPVQTAGQQNVVANRKTYSVFGVPTDFITAYGIGGNFNIRLAAITMHPFSLISITERVDAKGFACHVFADEEQVVMSFSIGRNLVYARSAKVPTNTNTREELLNFYYETINLTYLYIKQNKQANVDTMIFSGLLNGQAGLAETVERFSGVPITYISAARFIKNCSDQVFHEYLLAIASTLVTDYSNFASLSDKENRIFKSMLKTVTTVMLLLFIGAGGFTGYRYLTYSELVDTLVQKTNTTKTAANKLNKQIGDKLNLMYQNESIEYLRQREAVPLNIYVASQEMLGSDTYAQARFVKTGQQSALMLTKNESLPSYLETYNLSLRTTKYVDAYAEKGSILPMSKSVMDLKGKAYQKKFELLQKMGR